MAAQSSILAWRIPWTEEPGGLYSIGSQSQTWLKSPSAVIWEPKKIRSVTVSIISIYLPCSDGTRCHDLCC